MEDKQLEIKYLKQKQLETLYKSARLQIERASNKFIKWHKIRIFDKRNLKNLQDWQDMYQNIFKALREETRKNHPERFIKSE